MVLVQFSALHVVHMSVITFCESWHFFSFMTVTSKGRVYWKPACCCSPHEMNPSGGRLTPFSSSLSLLLVFSCSVDHHKPLQCRAGVNITLDLRSLSSSLVLQTHHALPLLASTVCCSGSDLEEACLSTEQH